MDHQNGSAKYVFIKAIKNTSIVLVIATLNAICYMPIAKQKRQYAFIMKF